MGRLVAVCLVLFAGGFGLWLIGHLFPQFQGSEFSPFSFSRREFQIASLAGRTVVQPARLACPMEISKHLTNATRTTGIERWDLIALSRRVDGFDQFEASVLINAFEARDSEHNLFWEKWSKAHPGLAKLLWPAVQQLAIHQAYFAIPNLLQRAAPAPTAEELASIIASSSMQAGIDQAHRELAKQDYNDARITLEWAKSFGKSSELDTLEKSIRAGLATLSTAKQ
jgi:hypothetical protein